MHNVRNGFLAGIFIGIGCVANVVSNNVVLGPFLFSLALLSICILQLKLCTGVFAYIENFKNMKDNLYYFLYEFLKQIYVLCLFLINIE